MVKKLATAALIVTAFTSQSAQADTIGIQTWDASITSPEVVIGGIADMVYDSGIARFDITLADNTTR